MDSKVKRVAVVLALLMIVFVVASVVGMDFYAYVKKTQNAQETANNRQTDTEQSIQAKEGIFTNASPEELSAFMWDETFFDREKSAYEKQQEKSEKKLSLVATSVEKDLRVQVLNDLGQLLTGQELYVVVNGSAYKDLDKDGIVYVGDLSPGIYQVSVQELEGYSVPSTPTEIRVKDKVEYTPIEDISLLIKTEADINAEVEDTGNNGAEEDKDETELTDIRGSDGNYQFGIDVSKWNKVINWEKVKAAGVDFAIIRCGYRGSVTGALVEDPYFFANLEGAKKAGVEVGLYFFTQATSAVEAVEEASMVLALVGDQKLEYPIFIDTEGAGGNGRADGLDVATRTEVCDAFCETISGAGYKAGIYASRNWLNNMLDTPQLDDNVIWLAEYRETPIYEGKYELWQYTSSGTIDGIEGRVDFDISYIKEND